MMLRVRNCAPVFALLLAGCNHDAPTNSDDSVSTTPSVPIVGSPNLEARTSLKLIRDGNEFSVGESPAKFLQVFVKPKPSFDFTDLPPGFQAPYSAVGWETSREGVGAIVYGKTQVVSVMRQLFRSNAATFQEIADTITKENVEIKPNIIQGSHVMYYFWESKPQRIMLSALETKRDGWHITEALGDTTVMDGLKMSQAQAKLDQPKVDLLIEKPKK